MKDKKAFIGELYQLLKKYKHLATPPRFGDHLISEFEQYDGDERYCGTEYDLLGIDIQEIARYIRELEENDPCQKN